MFGIVLSRSIKMALFLLCTVSFIILLGIIQLRGIIETNGYYKEIITRMQIFPLVYRTTEIPSSKNSQILIATYPTSEFRSTTKNLRKNQKKEISRLNCPTWFEWTNYYRKCVINYLKKQNKMKDGGVAWRNMHKAITACSGQAVLDMLKIKSLRNNDDIKFVILPTAKNKKINDSENYTENCTEVTLGIGNDTRAEHGLLKLIPGCQLHGADPFESVGKIFEKIGKYYEIAVGKESGNFTANVLVGPTRNGYVERYVPTIGFVEFIIDKVQRSNIDYLFFDNEGPEYEILPMFYRGGAVEKKNLNICQITVELHGPLTSYNMTHASYDELLRNLTVNSRLLPLWSSGPGRHRRMFFVDAESSYCVKKYFANWCIGN